MIAASPDAVSWLLWLLLAAPDAGVDAAPPRPPPPEAGLDDAVIEQLHLLEEMELLEDLDLLMDEDR